MAKSSGPAGFNIMQSIIDGEYSLVKIYTTTTADAEISEADLSIFDHARPLGISPGYSSTGQLVALAISDDKECRIIEFFTSGRHNFQGRGRRADSAKAVSEKSLNGRSLLQDMVLCRRSGELYAFDMARLCMSLHFDLSLRLTNGIDIQSGYSAIDRKPLTAIENAVGDSVKIMKDNIIEVFHEAVYEQGNRQNLRDLAMRAWVSQFLASHGNGEVTFSKVPKIDTLKHESSVLDMIAKISTDHTHLDQLKPNQKVHQITTSTDSNGNIHIASDNYKSRVRGYQNVKMRVGSKDGGSSYSQRGTTLRVSGRRGGLNTNRSLEGREVLTLTSIGRDDPTTAEAQRDATVLKILQGQMELLSDNPWIQNIWFPTADHGLLWPEDWSTDIKSSAIPKRSSPVPKIYLNASQQKAVNSMLSPLDDHRIVIIQGPPGTGKTSVIAAFVRFSVDMGQTGIWLVAQSNVAVKNIAEKLLAVGFDNWRILVSKDFHYNWHEHLYTKVRDNVIRSDDFFMATARIRNCPVILCTLSMLSNQHIPKFMKHTPLSTLVVDEASQIEIGQYISIFSDFNTIRKACFIGDDKQLPPYGQEDLQDLQSIFEVSHLRTPELNLFLDTQYRMPPQIGTFISDAVYEGKLQSNPLHPISEKINACYFVDVPGKEKMSGDSFKNEEEAKAILALANFFQEEDWKYRIITPYEGQRSYIEAKMKEEGLNWGDKCFNVDSFQGNEEDHIIISLVRSQQLGFLTNLRRTNVMLTRCKKGMYIVSSKNFLAGRGADSLVGQLAATKGAEAWLTIQDIESENFSKFL